MASSQQQQHHQGLPSISSLTNGLPQTSPNQQVTRDSGTWPQVPSKHQATNSQGLGVHTLLNPDDSPPRNSIPSTPLSAQNPNAARSSGGGLPSINQGFHHDPIRNSRGDYPPTLDSRRSSVDSRMHQTFNSLYINNPVSPYESANNSQVSLAASLRRPNGAPMTPLSARSSMRGIPAPRIAPPIMPVGRMSGAPDPTAAKPTQGFAWAFPDGPIPEEREQDSDSDESGVSHGRPSRQNSFVASSIRSSVFSNDSQMPQGQRRFDDEAATTHHHTMQHRSVSALQGGDMAGGIGNYSRTSELRVSHKLAERKRRSEMKDLFEDLNKAVPANASAKASKWEILTKAIDHIKAAQLHERALSEAVARLQRDSDYGREAVKENDMLKTELAVMHQHLRRLDPNVPHIYGHFTSQLNHPVGSQANGGAGIALPPLNTNPPPLNSYGGAPPPQQTAAMQGVEYGYGR